MKLSPWEPDLRTIVERIDTNDIDLQPDFQRQEIWSPSKKVRLIDTILRGWSIPPVFLVVAADGRMDVLDGQQRLAAVRDFMHNEFPIDGQITPIDSRIQKLDGTTYRRLSPSEKRLFDQYTLRCFKITDYSPDEPSELFYRLNQPSMLTAGEQRNAFYGPAREQLKTLVERFEASGNDKKTIGFSNARLAYDDIVARLLFFLEIGRFSIKGTEGLISQRFRSRDQFPALVIDRAQKAIDYFSSARREALSVRLNKASVLSWLLFFSRFEDIMPTLGFMDFFVHANEQASPRTFVKEAFKVFQDRASLRVTDVSSVVYRDFCLWYAYDFSRQGELPDSIPVQYLERVYDAVVSRDDATFEFVLTEIVDIEAWSRLS